jgi:hypothetical protein
MSVPFKEKVEISRKRPLEDLRESLLYYRHEAKCRREQARKLRDEAEDYDDWGDAVKECIDEIEAATPKP